MELIIGLKGPSSLTPKRSVKGNTSRGGLPFWGPLGLWQSSAQRTLARSVLIKTARLGSRFAQATGESKFSTFLDFVFDTSSEVQGITDSLCFEATKSA